MIDNLFSSNVNAIKIASLYFDKIVLVEHIDNIGFASENPPATYTTSSFRAHVQPLVDEQIISFENDPENKYLLAKDNISYGLNDDRVTAFFTDHVDVFFKKGTFKKMITWGKEDPQGSYFFKPTGKLKSEVKEVFRVYEQDFIENSPFGLVYYSMLLSSILSNIDKGNRLLTSSTILNEIVTRFFNSKEYFETRGKIIRELNVNPNVAFESLKIALPNIGQVPMDDILELRLKLKDELQAFRIYMQDLHLDLGLLNDQELTANAKKIVESKIKPALEDLKRKTIETTKNVPTRMISELKDPKSYCPLLLTFTENISNTLAIFVSLGIVSLSTAIEYFKENKEVKSNGIYYLLKLQAKI